VKILTDVVDMQFHDALFLHGNAVSSV